MLSIIISSYKPKLYTALEKNIAETCGIIYEIIKVDNPGVMGICKAYNLGAEKSKYKNLLFLHEDVKFISNNWGERLVKQLNIENTGAIGLAGSEKRYRLPYGFYSGRAYQNYMYLHHYGEEISNTNLNNNFINIKVIDGVFMAMKKEIFEKFKFNEQLKGFHFYDIDLSIRTSEKYNNYLATYIRLEHFSKGNFGNQWIKACLKFHKEYHYNYDSYNPKELRDIRNFWYDRLTDEEINIINRIRFSFNMGCNKDTLKSCLNFIFSKKQK